MSGRVLIVEDNDLFRSALSESLTLAGYEVRGASDLADARRVLAEFAPSVVVTDIYMHGREEGLELLDWVRNEAPGLPVIVMSGEGDFDVGARAAAKGAFEVLSKTRIQAEMDRFRAVLDEATSAAGGDAQQTRARAGIALDEGEYSIAAGLIEGLPPDERTPDDMYLLSLAHALGGRSEDQRGVLESLREADPMHEAGLRDLADIYLGRGENLRAADALRDLLEAHRGSSTDKAIAVAEEILGLNAALVDVRDVLAEAYLQKGERDRAALHISEVAELQLRDGDLSSAKKSIARLRSLQPDNAAIWNRLDERVQSIERDVSRLLDDPQHSFDFGGQLYVVCSRDDCLAEAEEAGVAFRFARSGERCDFCGQTVGSGGGKSADAEAKRKLSGKLLFLLGGRFPQAYGRRLEEFGAESIWHEGVDNFGQIPGLVAKADGLVIITGAGHHSGSAKAEIAARQLDKPFIRVASLGAGVIVSRILEELAPRL